MIGGMPTDGVAKAAQVNGTIFVSPTGDDAASGSRRHPLRSLDKALARVRGSQQADCIELTEGVWELSHPICLTAADTRTADAPLTILGAGAGKTVLTGGRQLTGFTVDEQGVWTLDLSPILPAGSEVTQLFVDDTRAVLARTPNEWQHFQTGVATETIADKQGGVALTRLTLPGEAVEALRTVDPYDDDLRITLLHAWDMTRRHVECVSLEDSTLLFGGRCQPSHNHVDRESQFYLDNHRSFLDAPGEYFVDTKTNTLYYLPREGQRADEAVVTLPFLKQLVTLQGEAGRSVENIRFEGMTFSHTARPFPRRGDNPTQAAAQVGAAIDGDYVGHITFEGCEVSHVGGWALAFGEGCRNNTVEHCYLHDIGAGGIRLGTTVMPQNEEVQLTRGNTIHNNILREGSRLFPTGVGVILFHTSDNQVTHNEIADFLYTGVSVGWVWGYSHSPSKRNKILYNHIHHIGWGVLSDMGGVYTLGISEGTEVSHNYIHDIWSYGYGGWGLYTDEGSTDIRMEYNLVCRCKSSGFHQHYGKENVIRNNIFVDNARAQLEATRTEPDHLPFTFESNIISYQQGNMYGINWRDVNFACDRNIYWNATGVNWNGLTMEEWLTATGKDSHSLITDPQFAAPEQEDYTPLNKEALQAIGFTPFDPTEAGVITTDDPTWGALATQPILHPVTE